MILYIKYRFSPCLGVDNVAQFVTNVYETQNDILQC